jgi:rare lipoprotein A
VRALAAGALAFLAACSHGRVAPAALDAGTEVGVASYYGREFEGRQTASGAVYDGKAMTCAHRAHPFGSWLEVTDLDSGRRVTVRVTDRGPFVKGRVVDLSLAAARALGMVERGLARVSVLRVQ